MRNWYIVGVVLLIVVSSVTCGKKSNKPHSPAAQATIEEPAAPKIEEWEHGYRSHNVVATRYANDVIGYNIGFTFPKNPNNSDSPKVLKWFEQHGGTVLSMGGWPGAEVGVRFRDVNDRDTANRKLLVILPELSAFMDGL